MSSNASTTVRPASRFETLRIASRARRRPGIRALLPLADLLAVLALAHLSVPLAGSFSEAVGEGSALGGASLAALILGTLSVMGLLAAGEYDPDGSASIGPGRRPARLLLVAAATSWVLIVFSTLTGQAIDLSQVIFISFAAPVAWSLLRILADAAYRREPERVVVIGTGAVARRVCTLAERHPRLGLEIVGFLDDEPLDLGPDSPPVLGTLEQLDSVLEHYEVDRVMVAFSPQGDGELVRLLRRCDRHDVSVDVVPRFFDLLGDESVSHSIGGLPLLGLKTRHTSRIQLVVKRILDVVIAGLVLAVTAPVLIAVALAIKVSNPGPVFFRQARVGRDGRMFELVKFRTMTVGDDETALLDAVSGERVLSGDLEIEALVEIVKAKGSARVFPLGAILRRASLDELPQLWNVVAGQMSLVGPRPLRSFEVAALDDWQTVRQAMRPGITGLWQILGRSEVPWHERMQLDYSYVRHWSLANDVRILFGTVPAVLRGQGAK